MSTSASSPPPIISTNFKDRSTPYGERLSALAASFQQLYGYPCEHIDYSGYGVLPMALSQDTLILVALTKATPARLTLRNSNAKKFPERIVDNLGSGVVVDSSKHDWANYVLAGVKGVLESGHLPSIFPTLGMSWLVDGQVPMGSGLSSSSSLVCASALAMAYAHAHTFADSTHAGALQSKTALAELCARSERFVGTEGGGMDQAISFLAETDKAKHIEFDPLRSKDVTLPEGTQFVIANSLVEANKYVTASTCYNMRVVECRVAAILLAKSLGLEWSGVRRLIQVQQLSGLSLDQLAVCVNTHLHTQPYTAQEAAHLLGISESDLVAKYFGSISPAAPLYLHKRALHVFTESARVFEFAAECARPGGASAERLGKLMSESHTSCAQLFECSCPELDQLTEICRRAGALGSRLTGAGWGGCTVSLVPSQLVARFCEEVKREYYDKRGLSAEGALFATSAGGGAAIFTPY